MGPKTSARRIPTKLAYVGGLGTEPSSQSFEPIWTWFIPFYGAWGHFLVRNTPSGSGKPKFSTDFGPAYQGWTHRRYGSHGSFWPCDQDSSRGWCWSVINFVPAVKVGSAINFVPAIRLDPTIIAGLAINFVPSISLCHTTITGPPVKVGLANNFGPICWSLDPAIMICPVVNFPAVRLGPHIMIGLWIIFVLRLTKVSQSCLLCMNLRPALILQLVPRHKLLLLYLYKLTV